MFTMKILVRGLNMNEFPRQDFDLNVKEKANNFSFVFFENNLF